MDLTMRGLRRVNAPVQSLDRTVPALKHGRRDAAGVHAYWSELTAKHSLRPHITFNSHVETLLNGDAVEEGGGRRSVDKRHGELGADAWRISRACGRSPGLVSLRSGSSAIQPVPKLAQDPSIEVVQFIRAPLWCISKVEVVLSSFVQWIFAYVPGGSWQNCPQEYQQVMTPDCPPSCKRLLFGTGYHRSAGWRGSPAGVETTQGEEIPVDVIIFVTDFTVTQYILKMIAPVLYGAASSFSVTPAACDAYNAKIRRRLEGSVLTQCVSWYRAEGGTGKVTSVFPGPITLFWWWMRKPVWGDYEVMGGERWRKAGESGMRKMNNRSMMLFCLSRTLLVGDKE
ncbi:hypothetical protein FIBSPDRAFT_944502 [Athelia psychrophila]|uniref:Uncharacterized protein n=1 Tax=Athelia psychrophila TaxID=1759441 RepID=A0A166UNQ0_9AGAM|nr:hypothetical protein FIBSPDRAFT_944502 [Fibularhizoctonia sp. CBS 109695]